MGTSAWDSEGNPKKRTIVIEKGVMTNFLFDQKLATLLNERSTGNAQLNPNKGGNMSIEMNNLVVNPGTKTLLIVCMLITLSGAILYIDCIFSPSNLNCP